MSEEELKGWLSNIVKPIWSYVIKPIVTTVPLVPTDILSLCGNGGC
jgi:hypothetical protein